MIVTPVGCASYLTWCVCVFIRRATRDVLPSVTYRYSEPRTSSLVVAQQHSTSCARSMTKGESGGRYRGGLKRSGDGARAGTGGARAGQPAPRELRGTRELRVLAALHLVMRH